MSDEVATNTPEADLSANAGDGSSPSDRPGVVGYLRDGVRIARWDGAAVERVSLDRLALIYGACFTVVGNLLSGMPALFGVGAPPDTPRWPFVLFGLVAAGVLQLAVSAIATGVVHGAAKLLFGGSGTYLRLLRVLWVGSVVLWVAAVPFIGPLVGGVLYLLVALIAISDVEGVERLQALILVVGLRALIFLAGLAMA